jgi:hypothetical protein
MSRAPPAGRLPPERLRHLARQIHLLGERPLFELLSELQAGAPFAERVERYADLAPLAGFIEALGGRDLPTLRDIGGGQGATKPRERRRRQGRRRA